MTADNHARTKKPIGEFLVSEDLISQAELLEALSSRLVIDGRRERLGETIRRLGFVTDDDIARVVAKQLGLEYAGSNPPAPHQGAADILPETLARRHQVAPLWHEPDGTLVVLCSDPTDIVAMDDVRLAAGARRLRPIVTSADHLDQALKFVYTHEGQAGEILELLEDEVDYDLSAYELEEDVEQDAPVIRLAENIIAEALHGDASDIHIEPGTKGTTVRYRIDGVMVKIMDVPRGVHGALISRVKLIAGMDIAERRRPQDGRCTFRSKGSAVDLRVSTLPCLHGEKIVMRLLRKGAEQLLLSDVGLTEEQHALILGHIERPQGLCLLTGPTGAGKTSTLYAFLDHLASEEHNLITIEDPIEYELPGVNQTQVNPRINFTFGSALRTVLRQDPDVVMVGEIRDLETAELAMQASLTGHMVFSTLHTNDAPGAVTRLSDLGIPEYLIASSLTLVIAQRLARRICAGCIEDTYPSETEIERLGLSAEQIAEGEWKAGAGCQRCNYTGYRGRVGLFEILSVDRGLRAALNGDGGEEAIRAAAARSGMQSLREDGIAKARAGMTTLDEVLRVTPTDLLDAAEPEPGLVPPDGFVEEPAAEDVPDGTAPASQWVHPARGRLVVADPDPAVRIRIHDLLGRDYEVVDADSGDAALELIGAQRPVAALIAADLDGMSGHELTHALRSRPVTVDLPVMILSADGDPEGEVAGLRAGADSVVPKPLDTRTLVVRLAAMLNHEVVTGTSAA